MPKQGKCKCLIVRYIPDDTREEDLRLVFGKYGRLEHVTLPRHRDTGNQRTFAFVEYHSANDASKARSRMDSRIFLNRRINVDYAYDQKYQERRRGVISGASYQYGSPQPYRGRRSRSHKRSRSRSSRYRGHCSRSYSRAPRDRENHHFSSRLSNSMSPRRTPDEMRRPKREKYSISPCSSRSPRRRPSVMAWPKSIVVCGGPGGASAPASAGGSAAVAAEEKKRRRGAEEEERRRAKRGRGGK